MKRLFSLIGFASLCIVACASFVGSAVVSAIERVVDFIGSPFASLPRLAYEGPDAPRVLGSSWCGIRVDRHEAGVSRRSAQRNI